MLTIAREVKKGLEKKNQGQMQNKPKKRPFQLLDEEDTIKPIGAPLVKRSFPLVKRSFHPAGSMRALSETQTLTTWMPESKWIMLFVWVRGHMKGNCLFRRTRNTAPAQPTQRAPPVVRKLEFTDRRTSLPSQQYTFNQAQKRPRAGARISEEIGPGSDAPCPEQWLWRCHP